MAAGAPPERKLKVCLAGEPAVGKTSLVRRFVLDAYDDRYIETIGAKVSKRELAFFSLTHRRPLRVELLVWDVMGQKGCRELLREAYFRHAQGVLLVCDLTEPSTLLALPRWMATVRAAAGDVPLRLLANKVDLRASISIGIADLVEFREAHGCPFLLTSAKTGEGVAEGFAAIVEAILREERVVAAP